MTTQNAWAFGASLGVPVEIAAGRTFASTVVNFVDGATMIGGAIGVVLLVHRPRRPPPLWLPLALAWIGSGFLFAWGLWGLANVLGDTALVRNRPGSLALINLLGLIQLLAGLIIGLVTLLVLAERDAAVQEPTPRLERL